MRFFMEFWNHSLEKVLPSSLQSSFVLTISFYTGLVVSNGELWRRNRQMVEPAFHKKVIHKFVDEMQRQAKHLTNKLDTLRSWETIDIDQSLIYLTLDVIGKSFKFLSYVALFIYFLLLTFALPSGFTAFGTLFGLQQGDGMVARAMKVMFGELNQRLINPLRMLMFLSPSQISFRKAWKTVVMILEEAIAKRSSVLMKYKKTQEKEMNDDYLLSFGDFSLIDILLTASDPDTGTPLSHTAILHEVFNFYSYWLVNVSHFSVSHFLLLDMIHVRTQCHGHYT
jgi:hypothetical protein